MALSKLLVEQHGGEVPRNREALEALPASDERRPTSFSMSRSGEKTIAVDTHIFRVANRTGLAPGETPREVEDQLMKIVPDAYVQHAHHWLILHGRYVCVARKPLCPTCVVLDLCLYKDKTSYPVGRKIPYNQIIRRQPQVIGKGDKEYAKKATARPHSRALRLAGVFSEASAPRLAC